MCTTNIYTYVYPDGRKEQTSQPSLCSASRHGQACVNNVIFKHPTQFIGASPSPSYLSQFPPTPTYTPRSSTPNYRSGDESDRSHHSSSSNRQRRSSGIYINGQRVVDLNRREHNPSRHERILLVDGPPTPRTPPQAYEFARSAPSSPNAGSLPYIVDPPREISSYSRRPVIVDDRPRAERPRIHIEVVDPNAQRTSKHDRHSSTSSRESLGARSGTDDEARERRRRREERRAEKEREEEETRQQRIRARIAKANAEINKRQAVPMPPAPLRASSFSSTAATLGRDEDILEGMNKLSFEEARREEKSQRIARKEKREEDEAQRQRLAERMMPRRRASVGPGSRRHRVLYDDGVYRWE